MAHGTNGPDGVGSLDLLRFDQLLDQHQSGVGSGLDDGVDEQVPVATKFNSVPVGSR